MAKEEPNNAETISAIKEFAIKTDYVKDTLNLINFLDPRLDETDVLKKCLFYFTNTMELSQLQDVFGFLANEASDKAEECKKLSELVGELDLEGIDLNDNDN